MTEAMTKKTSLKDMLMRTSGLPGCRFEGLQRYDRAGVGISPSMSRRLQESVDTGNEKSEL
jgi:hypothetical protein